MVATEVKSQRATALPPEARRAAIIAATLPLLLEHGSSLTTRRIADAAGIAEGTIFRVFPDKDALISAVVTTACDTTEVEAALAAIDASAPFEARLVRAVAIVQRRMTFIWRLMSAVDVAKLPEQHRLRRPVELVGIERLFEAERERLRCEPRSAAQLLRGLTLAATHPALNAGTPMPPDEVVSLLLDGVRLRPNGGASC